MTVQIAGYTMSVVNGEGGVVFSVEAASISTPADANYEQAMWDALDAMASYFDAAGDPVNYPEYYPFTPRLVRHEKEDVALTHP